MPRNQLENMWIHKKSFGEKILKKITAPTKIPYMPRNEKIRGALNPHCCGIGFPEIFFQRSEDLTAIQMQADNPSSQSLSKIRHTRND